MPKTPSNMSYDRPSPLESTDCRSEPRGPGLIGAALLLMPLITLAVAVVYLKERKPPIQAPPGAPVQVSERAVDAWLGRASLAQGGDLCVSLSRLHGDPVVQRFDERSLRDRFGLQAGEPWSLELVWTGEAAIDSSLVLEGLRVADASGAVLRPFTTPGAPEPQQVVDPLQMLLAAPERLEPDSFHSVVLWGEAPAARAWLSVDGLKLNLSRDSLRAPDEGSILASLDEAEWAGLTIDALQEPDEATGD